MDDGLPPDLPRLRTLETWAAHYLTRIRTRIAAVERQQAQQQPRCPRPRPRGPLSGHIVPVHRIGAWRRTCVARTGSSGGRDPPGSGDPAAGAVVGAVWVAVVCCC